MLIPSVCSLVTRERGGVVSAGAGRLFRSRVFLVALCASVFVLALETRVCLFHTYKLCIKAFADDYDRLKVKASANRSAQSLVSVKRARHFIALIFPQTLPDFRPYEAAGAEDAARRLVSLVGLRRSIRPPPLQ